MKKTAHLALTRKYRPQLFDDVVGQEAVSTTLKNAVSSGRTAHAYLFFGPRGCGKTTSARILAKALNCAKGPTPTPCGECPACTEIAAGSSIDVLELDAASNTQVDKIREMIIETVALAPTRDRYKVFIIDEVHMLSTGSFNALLKTLEEPPAHVVFVLATTELAKIPATIVSRCQRFRFRPLGREDIAGHLKRVAALEKITVEAKALELFARAAGGALRDAMSLLDQAVSFCDGKLTRENAVELLGMLPEELLLDTARAILDKDAAALNGLLERMSQEGYDPSQLLKDLRERFEDLYMFRLGVLESVDEGWKPLADGRGSEVFSFLIKRVNRILEDLRRSDAPQSAFELGLFGLIESAYDLAQWVERLEALEKRLESGGGSAAQSAPTAARTPAAEAPVRAASAPKAKEAPKPSVAEASAPAKPKAAPANDGGSTVDGSLLERFLERVQQTKPALAGMLGQARFRQTAQGEFRLSFDNTFNMERAKKEQSFIEKELSSVVGHAASLHLEVESAAPAPKAEPEALPDDPGLKKVLGVFGGKPRPVQKK
ncbi:MAG: DNA polymerase III subunit gamma/tau [Elusimicrobiota bacterium]